MPDIFFVGYLVGESSGKPSTSIIKNVDTEVHKVKKELTELQKVILLPIKFSRYIFLKNKFFDNNYDHFFKVGFGAWRKIKCSTTQDRRDDNGCQRVRQKRPQSRQQIQEQGIFQVIETSVFMRGNIYLFILFYFI